MRKVKLSVQYINNSCCVGMCRGSYEPTRNEREMNSVPNPVYGRTQSLPIGLYHSLPSTDSSIHVVHVAPTDPCLSLPVNLLSRPIDRTYKKTSSYTDNTDEQVCYYYRPYHLLTYA